jgi:hypothetical protein
MRKVFLLFCSMLLMVVALNAQTVNVTFQADMRVAIATGYFDPGTNTLTCPGDFNNWLNEPPANTLKVMTDDNSDGIYTITIAMAPDSTYGYKFNIGVGWDGKDESQGNRSLDVGSSDTTLSPCFFNNYTPYTGVASPVTFNVDMHLPAKGDFHPATDFVYVAGNFTDWGTNAIKMSDPEGDSIYTVTVDTILSGSVLYYKFIYSTGEASSGSWESPAEGDDIIGVGDNRVVGITNGDNVITRYWNNTNPNIQLADGNIFFEIDMSVAHELGVFNPDVDSVQIRGAFNGWNDSQPDKSLLNQDPANPDDWYLDVPFVQAVLNGSQAYKYFIKNGPGSTPYSNTGWEVPIGNTITTDRNRVITFMGTTDQEAGLTYFGNIKPDWVIPAGTTVECEFSVDMHYATVADTQGTNPVFVPGTDSVFWIPRQPLYYAVNKLAWPGGYPRVLELKDPDGDMIYTGTLTINGPAFNGFLYDYAYSSTSGLILEDGGQGGARVRFIAQKGPRSFVTPFTMPQDVWSNSDKPEESEPVITSVREITGTPIVYSLSQNYPNPFNPVTMIRFSIPEQGLVTLKVYNLLGEEVATLINKEMNKGSYEVDFKGTNYSSGIYFYKITTNKYVATRKMMLLK